VQSAFTPIAPVRALDSRSDTSEHFSPTHELDIWQVTGGSIPSGATAVVLNLTVVNANSTTLVTLWPDGTAVPGTSNLDVLGGKTISTLVQVGVLWTPLVARTKRRNCNASERSLCRRRCSPGALVDSEQGGGMEQGHTAS
jgi:hypothetical protein